MSGQATVEKVEAKPGYVVLQVIRVYEIPVTGIDKGDCLDNAYSLTTEEIESIGELENVEVDYAEFRRWVDEGAQTLRLGTPEYDSFVKTLEG